MVSGINSSTNLISPSQDIYFEGFLETCIGRHFKHFTRKKLNIFRFIFFLIPLIIYVMYLEAGWGTTNLIL